VSIIFINIDLCTFYMLIVFIILLLFLFDIIIVKFTLYYTIFVFYFCI